MALGVHEQSASTRYCRRVKSAINRKPGKTAAMAMLGSPPLEVCDGISIVSTYKTLGVTVDEDLTFTPLLKQTLSVGRSVFQKMFRAADAAGFPMLLIAAQTSIRIEPKVLYASAFLAIARDSEHSLNKMQYHWARDILSLSQVRECKWLLAVASCGWSLRLGSRMWEYACVARARALLMPINHPVTRLLHIASALPFWTWPVMIKRFMEGEHLPRVIQDITACSNFCAAELEQARSDKVLRRTLLKRYRWEVVRPVLQDYDGAKYTRAAKVTIQPWGATFLEFVPTLAPLPQQLTLAVGVPAMRVWQRIWNIVRLYGCWPDCVHGGEELSFLQTTCKLCGAFSVDVSHAVCECPGTLQWYAELAQEHNVARRAHVRQLALQLFGPCPIVSERLAHIAFVGQAIHARMVGVGEPQPAESCSISDLIETVACKV